MAVLLGFIMTVVEELIKKIEDWTTLDDPLRCEILSDVPIWLEKEQQQLNNAWQDGAATAQSDAAKSISLERAKKYARHQHFLGTQGKDLVEFEDWAAKD